MSFAPQAPETRLTSRSILGGRLADWYAVRKAKQNYGISEAEHKLHLFVFPLIGMVIGLLMMGLGPYYEAHWIVFVLGASVVNFVGPIATAIALAYAFDCFHSVRPDSAQGPQAATQDAAPYLLTIILVGMTIAFGFVSLCRQATADIRAMLLLHGVSNSDTKISPSLLRSLPLS